MSISYRDRVQRIQKPGDEQTELRRAKALLMRKRAKFRAAAGLEDKLRYEEECRQAQGILRELRRHVFDLEDLAIARQAGDVVSINQLENRVGILNYT